jgi:hypothetical protein
MRQIGVRLEALKLGGLGLCGRCFCCSSFLTNFCQVSVKMAKEQNLSLNTAKISGVCGRLMCCLSFENYQRDHKAGAEKTAREQGQNEDPTKWAAQAATDEEFQARLATAIAPTGESSSEKDLEALEEPDAENGLEDAALEDKVGEDEVGVDAETLATEEARQDEDAEFLAVQEPQEAAEPNAPLEDENSSEPLAAATTKETLAIAKADEFFEGEKSKELLEAAKTEATVETERSQ